ncbi:AI-2E family transporter [Haloplanus aerogenes]|uniref:AI-2E family transporter n=1 Tax=Haloplanus aerogenes TaxID=660522 RepID=A0A3M0CV69_9EURY|nr:AI-2E family transporter [Haloplanus aerogenes]AZH24057.1 AI-2E family transporter [Haloplanus aerogenes]RMB13168.1 putative PurR-regulated permease PerM [Haloplanus aerogenes]
MTLDRRYVLGGIFGLLALGAAVMLADILATVFFAVTVAYLLSPLREELTRRGLSAWQASLGTTATGVLAVVALALPLVVVVAGRLDAVISFLLSLPPTLTVDIYGLSATITLADARAVAVAYGRQLARSFATVVPVLALKLTVFVMVVFALLSHTAETHRALIALVPPSYRDVVRALSRRTRATLFAIYVLQAATAAGTFVVALVLFFLLGYPYFLTLAVLSAILQFLPVVGPSLLIGLLAVAHLVVGDPARAALVFVLGGILVAWLPDVVIRPRLARETADLPGSLYFVGFVGGLLTLGPVGVIAGPLAVALVIEMADLLSDELNQVAVSED